MGRRREDLNNKIFGQWKVIAIDTHKTKHVKWLCQCQCGTIQSISASDLKRGGSSKCKKCANNAIKDLTGQKVNDWTVLRRDIETKITARWKYIRYWCQCKCGHIQSLCGKNLLKKTSTRCQKCRYEKQKKYYNITPGYWTRLYNGAKRHNRAWNIDKEAAHQILFKQNFTCALTGLSIVMAKTCQEFKKKDTTTASLDRIDSSKGYEINNVQWIHKKLQDMKMGKSQEEFIRLCHLVARKHPLKDHELETINN